MVQLSKVACVSLAGVALVAQHATAQTPSGDMLFWPTSVVLSENVDPNNPEKAKWMVMVDADGSQIEAGSASTCMAADDLRLRLNDFISQVTTVFEPTEYELCGLTQSLELNDMFKFTHGQTQGLPLVFQYGANKTVERVNKEAALPMHNIELLKTDAFEMPRGLHRFEDVRNPFHLGEPLYSFKIAGPGVKDLLSATAVAQDRPARAFLVVKERVFWEETSGGGPYNEYVNPDLACQETCSCAKRRIARAFDEIGARRRLSRVLQTDPGCTGVGGDPNLEGKECCYPAVPCEGMWDQGSSTMYQRCAESQEVCNQGKLYSDGPGDGQDDKMWEGIERICPTYESCMGDATCGPYLDIFLNYTVLPLHQNLTEFYLKQPPLDVTAPLYTVVECVMSEIRNHFVNNTNDEIQYNGGGEMLPEGMCQTEIDACMDNVICARKIILETFVPPMDHPSLNYFPEEIYISDESMADTIALGEQLFNDTISCFPVNYIFSSHDGDNNDPKMVVLPLEEIPCACSNGTASTGVKTHITSMPAKTLFETKFDLCFASLDSIGSVQIQLPNTPYEGPDSAVRGVSKFMTPDVDLSPEELQSVRDCYLDGACEGEAFNLYELFQRAMKPMRLHPSSCGYMARDFSQDWNAEGGMHQQCKPFEVEIPIDEWVKKPEFPSVEVIVHDFGPESQPIEGMYDALYWLSFNMSNPSDLMFGLKFKSYKGITAQTVLFERPMVDPAVNEMNCHETCACSHLYLAKFWDSYFETMPPNEPINYHLPLKPHHNDIPCACNPDKRLNRHMEAQQEYNNYGDRETFTMTRIEVCHTAASYAIFEDYDTPDPNNLPSNWNWLCHCDSWKSFDLCMQECKMARGPWAWTCDGGEAAGFRVLDRFSTETENMRANQCWH